MGTFLWLLFFFSHHLSFMMEPPCAAAEGRICLVTPEHLSMSIPVYLMKAEGPHTMFITFDPYAGKGFVFFFFN